MRGVKKTTVRQSLEVNNRFQSLLFLSLQLGAILASLIFDNDAAKSYSWIVYLVQAVSFIVVTLRRKMPLLFFSPLSLLSLYVSLSFFLGNLAFSKGVVLEGGNYSDYLNWRNADDATLFFVVFGCVLMVTEYLMQPRMMAALGRDISGFRALRHPVSVFQAAFAATVFFVFAAVPFSLEQLGGAGSVAIVPITIAALVLVHFAIQRMGKARLLFYCILLLILSAISYGSKREAIFLVLPIALLEVVSGGIKLNWRQGFLLLLTCWVLVWLILVMTIQRGHGGYVEVGANFLDAMGYVREYVRSDQFLAYFSLNIETSYTYFHSMQAVEYVMSDSGLLAWGATIVKPLFLVLPTSVFSLLKPSSFTNSYTLLHDPNFRALGGSWVPNVYAEMFWNFSYFGMLPGLAILLAFRKGFILLVKRLCSGKVANSYGWLYAYLNIIFYFRGSGLDLYIFYVVLGLVFGWIFSVSGRIRLGRRELRQ